MRLAETRVLLESLFGRGNRDPKQVHISVSESEGQSEVNPTWTVIANHIKLLLITFANASTVERCKSDTAACNRMRDLTGGLHVMPSASCPEHHVYSKNPTCQVHLP